MLHQSSTMLAIPPFETGWTILARSARLYRPREPLTVSQWSERHLAYDTTIMPPQVEIMDALSDPETAEVGLMGPAQWGKSEIGNGWIGWSIEHDPADMLICQPDKALMQDYVVRRISPMIERTPALKERLLPLSNADNIFLKQFRGMLLTSIWPVGAQFRARPVPRGWLDDYDQIDPDIDGQGDAIGLLDGRQTHFEGRDTKFVSSSPAREDGSGIEAFVAAGTDERMQPECPSCGERFEPRLPRDLKFLAGTPDEAEQSAYVLCPASGCILEPDSRRGLIDSLGRLPNRGFVAHNPGAGKRRRTFRIDGLLAFTSWGKLARGWRDAQLAWELRQDEGALRTFFNVKGGINYRSALSGEKPIEVATLASRREKGWKSGKVPRGVRVIVITVDVQFDRFECAAIGYGEGLESWIIRRWSIDALEDGLSGLAPLTHPEHFRVLLPLFDRTWKLDYKAENGETVAKTLGIGVDVGGSNEKGDKATAGVKYLWGLAKAAGIHQTRLTLIKGGSNPKGELMPRAQFADQKGRGGANRSGPKLWRPNVHAIKNIIDARLRRGAPGPGYIHLPADMEQRHLDEMTAEVLEKGKWKALRARNETWDLMVYAYAVLLRAPFAQSRIDMRWVPEAYRVAKPANDDDLLSIAGPDAPAPVVAAVRQATPQRKTKSPTPKPAVDPRRTANWLNRRGR